MNDSYIVTQDEKGLLIIDQHALHERMMFESLQRRMRSRGSLESQRLITPATVPATPARLDALERLKPLLEKLGIEAEQLGPATIAVQAFPTLLFDRKVDPVEFIDDLLDRAEHVGLEPDDEEALHEVLDMMSCKAAVKAGDALKLEEIRELLASRERFDRVASCPHGRPTTIRLTVSELEKHFKRS
ncbi:MAG: hypothetical protein WD079_03075 [Phycisphaeraceae bacterium]